MDTVIRYKNLEVSSNGMVAIDSPKRIVKPYGDRFCVSFYHENSRFLFAALFDTYEDALKIASHGAVEVADQVTGSIIGLSKEGNDAN